MGVFFPGRTPPTILNKSGLRKVRTDTVAMLPNLLGILVGLKRLLTYIYPTSMSSKEASVSTLILRKEFTVRVGTKVDSNETVSH